MARVPGRLPAGTPLRRYDSQQRTLADLSPIRRDLIKRDRYLVPNSIVVTRGCPHHCDFCYKDAFMTPYPGTGLHRQLERQGRILRGASTHAAFRHRARHVAYAGGWKKLEPFWDLVIRSRRVVQTLPLLESVLSGFGRHRPSATSAARIPH